MYRLLLLPLLLLAACAGDHEAHEPEQVAPAETAAVTAERVGNEQVARIEVGETGYQPASVALEAGVPARLVFTRTADNACLEAIQIPAHGVAATPLPLGEPVEIAFMPEEAGTYHFVCGMDMMRGTLIVQG